MPSIQGSVNWGSRRRLNHSDFDNILPIIETFEVKKTIDQKKKIFFKKIV